MTDKEIQELKELSEDRYQEIQELRKKYYSLEPKISELIEIVEILVKALDEENKEMRINFGVLAMRVLRLEKSNWGFKDKITELENERCMLANEIVKLRVKDK